MRNNAITQVNTLAGDMLPCVPLGMLMYHPQPRLNDAPSCGAGAGSSTSSGAIMLKDNFKVISLKRKDCLLGFGDWGCRTKSDRESQ